jgi:hypothetical protein
LKLLAISHIDGAVPAHVMRDRPFHQTITVVMSSSVYKHGRIQQLSLKRVLL